MKPQGSPRLTVIAAVASNRVIGSGNALPWRLPEDLKRFKTLTMGHPIVMGRKTYESIGRPLPGRRNLVVTRNPAFRADGCECVPSLASAIDKCMGNADEIFVIGGAQIYTEALALADRLCLTEIDRAFPGDAFFPEVDLKQWRLAAIESHRAADGMRYRFATYERA